MTMSEEDKDLLANHSDDEIINKICYSEKKTLVKVVFKKKYRNIFSSEEEEDIFQDSVKGFLKRLKNRKAINESLTGYFSRILSNKAYDASKKLNHDLISYSELLGIKEEEPNDNLEKYRLMLDKIINGEIILLNERERLVLDNYSNKMKQKEIAVLVNKEFTGAKETPSSIGTSIGKIKTKITNYLRKQGEL
jgi:DNA-directed RNA polymerase specialized sigma24 family protein